MTKKLDLKGLQSIADHYDLFYIDLWGVIHNGIKLHEKAITVLKELSKKNIKLVQQSILDYLQSDSYNKEYWNEFCIKMNAIDEHTKQNLFDVAPQLEGHMV